MAVETDADRRAMLRDFGVDVTPATGRPFRAIDDAAYEGQQYGDYRVNDRRRVLTAIDADVAELTKQTAVEVEHENGTTGSYLVVDIRPDGTGFSEILLGLA